MRNRLDVLFESHAGGERLAGVVEEIPAERLNWRSLQVQGYAAAQPMVLVLQNCGDDLSLDNIIRQTKSLDGVALPMMPPTIRIHTDPHNVTPIRQIQMARFDGKSCVLLGDVLGEK